MIIAEIGQTFRLGLDVASELIYQAKKNGADLVKSQLFDSRKLYGEEDTGLKFEEAKALFDYAKFIGIEMFFSVFDVERVAWCEEIGAKRYKIAYSHGENEELLDAIISTEKPHLVSVSAVGPQLFAPKGQYLYCIPQYPTLISDLDFTADWRHTIFEEDFDGFSDHTIGLDASKIALARGARIIEKHFALTHDIETGGVDAPWSMTPKELAELKRWETVCREVL